MCSSNFVFACTQHLYSFHNSSCCNELPVPVLLIRTWVSRPRNWRQNTFKDRFRLRGAREHKTKKSNSTKCESLKLLHRRAIRIIYPVTVGMPYIFALIYARIPSLHSRHEDANKRFLRETDSIYAIARICYRPSVCPSVTRVDHTKTVENRIMKFSPYGSPIPLVSREQVLSRNSGGSPERGH